MQSKMNGKIVMLAGDGESSRFMYNGIKKHFTIEKVIMEGKDNRKKFIKKRIKKIGYLKVAGQIMFILICLPIIKFRSKNRRNEIIRNFNLSNQDFDKQNLIIVNSVNSDECLKILKDINPNIVIVNGTRIITKKILQNINATFINTHVGITPRYRGVHGAYWALVNNDSEHCGVTVHLVDSGIDTGGVLYQNIIEVSTRDNFTTYPLLQAAKGIELMTSALEDAINKNIKVKNTGLNSSIWTHPTIWGYLYNMFIKNVK